MSSHHEFEELNENSDDEFESFTDSKTLNDDFILATSALDKGHIVGSEKQEFEELLSESDTDEALDSKGDTSMLQEPNEEYENSEIDKSLNEHNGEKLKHNHDEELNEELAEELNENLGEEMSNEHNDKLNEESGEGSALDDSDIEVIEDPQGEFRNRNIMEHSVIDLDSEDDIENLESEEHANEVDENDEIGKNDGIGKNDEIEDEDDENVDEDDENVDENDEDDENDENDDDEDDGDDDDENGTGERLQSRASSINHSRGDDSDVPLSQTGLTRSSGSKIQSDNENIKTSLNIIHEEASRGVRRPREESEEQLDGENDYNSDDYQDFMWSSDEDDEEEFDSDFESIEDQREPKYSLAQIEIPIVVEIAGTKFLLEIKGKPPHVGLPELKRHQFCDINLGSVFYFLDSFSQLPEMSRIKSSGTSVFEVPELGISVEQFGRDSKRLYVEEVLWYYQGLIRNTKEPRPEYMLIRISAGSDTFSQFELAKKIARSGKGFETFESAMRKRDPYGVVMPDVKRRRKGSDM